MKKRKIKVMLILLLILAVMSGCTKTLTDNKNKPVKNENTGQTLTKNILCKPTNKETIKIYEENNVKIEKLPECKDYKISSGKYEGLWTTFFVKPLAYVLLKIGNFVKNYGLSVIIVSLIIRLIAFPLTKKATNQSEVMKKAQPELNKIQKKYADKKDLAGCLFAFIQLPIFIAFFEAVQRTPVIFEDKFLGLQLGTTPSVGITTATFYSYIVLMLIIAVTTYVSFKMNSMTSMNNMDDPTMKMMPLMMSGMIIVTAAFMPTGLGIYWVTSNLFTIFQNMLLKRRKEVHGKA